MKLAILAALALAIAPMGANAQAAPPRGPLIIVSGQATVTRPAEWVTLSMTVRGEGATQVEAMKALEATRASIEANIKRMAGLTGLTFTADSLVVQDIRESSCRSVYNSAEVLSQGACSVVGAVATIDLDVRFEPASRSGDVAAFAVQLGGKNIRVEAWGVSDQAGLRDQAVRGAFTSAQTEARLIATAAGGRLGEVLQIQDPQAGVVTVGSEQLELTATLSLDTLLNEQPQIEPQISMQLAAPPVTATARMTVEFKLER